MSLPMIVVANSAKKTSRGRWLLAGTGAFLVLSLVVANEVLRGAPIGARPPGWLIFGIAFGPFVLVYLTFLRSDIAHRFGLIEAKPAQAAMDTVGVTLTIDGFTLPRIPWNSLAVLERSGRDWRLIAEDGAQLAEIPKELMHPSPTWMDAPTFAELVVQMRPDRYALAATDSSPGLQSSRSERPMTS
jgi:hypothetical protein